LIIKYLIKDNGSGIISIIWNTLIITMISYFVFSIIESLAISEFQKLKEKELSIIVDESKKKLNIKGPDMQVITEVADVAFNYINSKLNNFDKTESMEDLKSEIDMTNNRPKEQNNITDKRSKPRKSKLYKNKY